MALLKLGPTEREREDVWASVGPILLVIRNVFQLFRLLVFLRKYRRMVAGRATESIVNIEANAMKCSMTGDKKMQE